MHKEFLSSLCYMLKMRATDTYKDLRTAVEKILTIIPDTDDMLVAAKAGGGEGDAAGEAATILSLAGLVEAEEVERLVETRLSERPVAPDEVLTMLALGADADLASVTAAVLSLKNPVGMVPRSELDRATARIAELDEKAGAARIDELVASNSTRVTPALEPEIRELARSNFALAQATVAKLPEQKPEKVATQPPPVGSLPDAGRANMSFHGGEIEVDPDSATLEARVEAHRKASAGKFKTYIEAYADLKKQGAA